MSQIVTWLKHPVLLNALLMKLAWISCVAGGITYGIPALILMTIHSWLTGRLVLDLPVVFTLAAIGLALDTLWMYLGVLDYGSEAVALGPGIALAPMWIVLLWIAVGFSLQHSLAFLARRPLVGALLVALLSPVSYLSGQSFGSVVIPSNEGLLILALVWFVLFFIVFRFTRRRLEGQDHTAPG